jgi:HEAT repeat protein
MSTGLSKRSCAARRTSPVPVPSLALALALVASAALAQTVRTRDVRGLAEGGATNIPKLAELLRNPSLEIRVEAVKAIVEIGTQASLDPLILATQDNDAEIQIRATDGLVNFYMPGYVRTGMTASLRRAGATIRARFSGSNDQVIDPYIRVRPEVVAAIGKLARGGISMESRANAVRAAGILRGGAAVPDLLEALRSKDDTVLYETLVAFQKIRDPQVAPKIAYLMRDPNPKVQVAAIVTTGLLQNKEALPGLLDAFQRSENREVRRAALSAMAMLPDPKSRELFLKHLKDRDGRLRGAAAEGLARMENPADLPVLEAAYRNEDDTSPRLSLAFAVVMLGKNELSEFSALQYLVNSLNSGIYKGEAYALLVEAARNPATRNLLYLALPGGTKDEKTQLARVLAASGDQGTVPHLEKLTRDPDTEVAREGLQALRVLKARL